MKNSPRFTQSDPPESGPMAANRACNIVTFYEDLPAAVRAQRAFDSLAQHVSPDRPVHATSWSFSMLGMSDLNAAVLLDAALADVLVVAAKGDKELPPRIAAWVEICMNKGDKAEPVVVALHDDGLESDGAAAPLCSSLEKIASRQGATFMCSHDLETCRDRDLPAEPIDDEARCPIRVAAGTLFPDAGCHRWWGIND